MPDSGSGEEQARGEASGSWESAPPPSSPQAACALGQEGGAQAVTLGRASRPDSFPKQQCEQPSSQARQTERPSATCSPRRGMETTSLYGQGRGKSGLIMDCRPLVKGELPEAILPDDAVAGS